MPSNAARAIAGKTSLRLPLLGSSVPPFQLLLPCPTCPPISCQALRCQVSHAAAAHRSTTDHHHAWRAQSIDSAHLSSGRQSSVPSNDRPPETVACPPSCLQRAPPPLPPFFPGPEQLKAARFSSSPSLSTLKPLLHWPSEAARSSCP